MKEGRASLADNHRVDWALADVGANFAEVLGIGDPLHQVETYRVQMLFVSMTVTGEYDNTWIELFVVNFEISLGFALSKQVDSVTIAIWNGWLDIRRILASILSLSDNLQFSLAFRL